MNVLSIRVADVVVVRVGLKMCGRGREEYIKSRKSKMLLFWSNLSRSALKFPKSLLNSESSMDGRLYMQPYFLDLPL